MAGYDAEHIARLIAKAEEPHVQALVESWGPPTPEDLALIARVFRATTVTHQAEASTASATTGGHDGSQAQS